MPDFCELDTSGCEAAVVSAIVRAGKENAPIRIAQMAIAAGRLIVLMQEKISHSHSFAMPARLTRLDRVYVAKSGDFAYKHGQKILIIRTIKNANVVEVRRGLSQS